MHPRLQQAILNQTGKLSNIRLHLTRLESLTVTSRYCILHNVLMESDCITLPPSPFHQFNLHQKWFHQLGNQWSLWPFYARNAALPQDNNILQIHNNGIDLYNTTSCFEWVTLCCHHKIYCHCKIRHRWCFLSLRDISWNIIFYNMNMLN